MILKGTGEARPPSRKIRGDCVTLQEDTRHSARDTLGVRFSEGIAIRMGRQGCASVIAGQHGSQHGAAENVPRDTDSNFPQRIR